VNVQRLSAFLESPQAAQLPAEELGTLQMLLARARATLGTSCEDDIWAEPFTGEDMLHAGLIGAAATAGFMAAFSDGPEVLACEAAVLMAPTHASSIAGVTGYVAGLTVRGVQAIVEMS
jgi:hypothetical protein